MRLADGAAPVSGSKLTRVAAASKHLPEFTRDDSVLL
jgi:hypothetical protein